MSERVIYVVMHFDYGVSEILGAYTSLDSAERRVEGAKDAERKHWGDGELRGQYEIQALALNEHLSWEYAT